MTALQRLVAQKHRGTSSIFQSIGSDELAHTLSCEMAKESTLDSFFSVPPLWLISSTAWLSYPMMIISKPLWREDWSLMTPAALFGLPDKEETYSLNCTQGTQVLSASVGNLPEQMAPKLDSFSSACKTPLILTFEKYCFWVAGVSSWWMQLGTAQAYPGITRHDTAPSWGCPSPTCCSACTVGHSDVCLSHSLNNLHL